MKRKVPVHIENAYKTRKTTRVPGQALGILTLLGPLGNPEHGAALYWQVRCNVCQRERPMRTAELGQRSKQKGCSRECEHERRYGKRVESPEA